MGEDKAGGMELCGARRHRQCWVHRVECFVLCRALPCLVQRCEVGNAHGAVTGESYSSCVEMRHACPGNTAQAVFLKEKV